MKRACLHPRRRRQLGAKCPDCGKVRIPGGRPTRRTFELAEPEPIAEPEPLAPDLGPAPLVADDELLAAVAPPAPTVELAAKPPAPTGPTWHDNVADLGVDFVVLPAVSWYIREKRRRIPGSPKREQIATAKTTLGASLRRMFPGAEAMPPWAEFLLVMSGIGVAMYAGGTPIDIDGPRVRPTATLV